MYAGDQQLDAVNMSFFADPWLFNCRNDKEQKAIIQAISAAATYASSVASCWSRRPATTGIDLNHPTTDEISPDFPPGAAVTRPVNNNCVVLPDRASGRGRRHRDRRGEPARRGTRRTATSSTWLLPAVRASRPRRSTRPRPGAGAVLVDGGRPRHRGGARPAGPGSGHGSVLRVAERHLDGRATRDRRRRTHSRGPPGDAAGCGGRQAA